MEPPRAPAAHARVHICVLVHGVGLRADKLGFITAIGKRAYHIEDMLIYIKRMPSRVYTGADGAKNTGTWQKKQNNNAVSIS